MPDGYPGEYVPLGDGYLSELSVLLRQDEVFGKLGSSHMIS